MLQKIKTLLTNKKSEFKKLCLVNELHLDYKSNRKSFSILKDIFYNREYADYFPFYKDAVIVDIGGHFGFFSIFASKNSGRNSNIISIEPSRNNYIQLKKNILSCHINNMTQLNIGIGEESGFIKLYAGNTANHSICRNNPLLLDDNSNFEEVEVKTLEHLILEHNLNKVDFLKMDCEGAEYTIIQNTPSYIFDRITTISMEFHDLKNENFTTELILNQLIENGFKIVKFNFSKTSMNLNYGKIIGTKQL